MGEYLHSDLTGEILAGFYGVFHRLGARRRAYTEAELVQALAVELQARGLTVRIQVAVPRRYRDRRIGRGRWTCWWPTRWRWR